MTAGWGLDASSHTPLKSPWQRPYLGRNSWNSQEASCSVYPTWYGVIDSINDVYIIRTWNLTK
jgi:hypothetical protein